MGRGLRTPPPLPLVAATPVLNAHVLCSRLQQLVHDWQRQAANLSPRFQKPDALSHAKHLHSLHLLHPANGSGTLTNRQARAYLSAALDLQELCDTHTSKPLTATTEAQFFANVQALVNLLEARARWVGPVSQAVLLVLPLFHDCSLELVEAASTCGLNVTLS